MTEAPASLVVVGGPGAAFEPLCAHLAGDGYVLDRRAGLPGGADGADGVLVDMGMELLPVLAWLRALRGDEQTLALPVWLVAGQPVAEASVAAALEAGADGVFQAPFAPDQVRARVARGLRLKHLADGLAARMASLTCSGQRDPLTGLPNGRGLQERLRDEFRRAQRYGDALALALVGVDPMRVAPDAHGPSLTEEAVGAVGVALRRCARDTDVVCRPGELQFALVLPRTSLGGALTLAERARLALQGLRLGPGGGLRVSTATGLSSFPHRTVPTPESLLRAAEEALHRARHAGVDRVCLAQGLVGVGGAPHGW